MEKISLIMWSIMGIFIVLFVALGLLVYKMTYQPVRTAEVLLPTLIIVGVCVLFILLFLMTAGLHALQLNDKTQALGLPSGSITALIALLLILIWVIASLFLINYTVPQNANNSEVLKFGQNFYTTMSTLVVAVVAFYFGSKSVAAAHALTTERVSQPTIASVTPRTGTQGQSVNLTITGSNFQSPRSVRLTRETDTTTDEIIATTNVSQSTQITCTVDIKSDQTPGEYDLIVVNSDGGEARRANVFTINSSQHSGSATIVNSQ